jgi:hypothetical protein
MRSRSVNHRPRPSVTTVRFISLNRTPTLKRTPLLSGNNNNPICERCHNKTEHPHILCECEVLLEVRFRCSGNNSLERSDSDEAALCRLLYFVGGKGLMAECRWRRRKDQKVVAVQGFFQALTILNFTFIHSFIHSFLTGHREMPFESWKETGHSEAIP